MSGVARVTVTVEYEVGAVKTIRSEDVRDCRITTSGGKRDGEFVPTETVVVMTLGPDAAGVDHA